MLCVLKVFQLMIRSNNPFEVGAVPLSSAYAHMLQVIFTLMVDAIIGILNAVILWLNKRF